MAWWGWLLLGTISAVAVVTIILLLISRRSGMAAEIDQLLDQERRRLRQLLTIERTRASKLESIATIQRDKLSKLEGFYRETKRNISEDRRRSYEAYLNDARAAGDELDRLLGIRADDTFKTGDKKGPTGKRS